MNALQWNNSELTYLLDLVAKSGNNDVPRMEVHSYLHMQGMSAAKDGFPMLSNAILAAAYLTAFETFYPRATQKAIHRSWEQAHNILLHEAVRNPPEEQAESAP